MKRLIIQVSVTLALSIIMPLSLLWLLTGQPQAARAASHTVCPAGPPDCDHSAVQAAVDAAGDGDVIMVASGTYTGVQRRPTPTGYDGPSVITQVVYISKSVTIQGGYTSAFSDPPDPKANPTTLDAQGQGRVIFITAPASGADINPTVEGLRITGGDAGGLGGMYYDNDVGGGVYIINATATISNNLISNNNTANFLGGGLYLYGSASLLDSNTISGNTAIHGGGLALSYSDAILSNNTIAGNTASYCGGGLTSAYGKATLYNNTITSNTAHIGGGLHLGLDKATLYNNTVISNSAYDKGGGLFLNGSGATLINNVVADNQAGVAGSGIYIQDSSKPLLLHTTIARNGSTELAAGSGGDGSGIYVSNDGYPSVVALINTILVSHTVGVTVTAGNTVTLEGTLWGSGDWANTADWGGAGTVITGTLAYNYWGDPAFLDPDGGDYHIGSASAARDVGTEASVNHDMDGQVRPMEWGHDIGADEYPGAGLDVVKRPAGGLVNRGQVLTYTIVVSSAGMANATGVIMTDTLNGWQQVITATFSLGGCSITDGGWGGSVICMPGTMVTGTTVVITLTTQVSEAIAPPQALTNTVLVMSNETTNSAQAINMGQDCHARINDTPTEYTSVQAAVDAASPGDLVKVAGYCLGAVEREGTRQQVYVDKSLTIQGGYTTTNWMVSAPDVNPTTLDALGRGRAVYIVGNISPTIEGLRITGGDATGLGGYPSTGADVGGGVYAINTTVTISSCQVFKNTADEGGGVYAINTTVTISNCQVFENTADEGGGVCLRESTATFNGNTFSGNIAADSAGGLYLIGGDVTFNGNTVSANVALGNAPYKAGLAGGLYIVGSAATFNGNTIISNSADSGGGLYMIYWYESGDGTFNNNTIAGNTANVAGGGLYLMNLANDITLNDNIITSNTAREGGGLYLDYDVTLRGNTISNNTADDGGGLFLRASEAILINNVVVDNQASVVGSGVYIEDGRTPLLLHTTFARNGSTELAAGSGGDGSGIYVDSGTVALTNTILVSHAVGITVTDGNTARLEATLWGNDTDWGGAGRVITGTSVYNYWGAPIFVDPDAGDYHISESSAAKDVGVDAGVFSDIDGESRPNGDGYDIGADEFHTHPALHVTKRANSNSVQAGAQLTYTLRVTNTGDVDLHAIITDILPTHVTPSDILTWTPIITAPDGVWMETVVVTVEAGYAGSLVNTVQVTTEQGATGTDVYTVTVTSACTPLQSVGISGPTAALGGTAVSLNAVYTPTNASGVTLLWDNGAMGVNASYTWPEGVHSAVVTATAACGDSVTATHTVTVTSACTPLQSVRINGPTSAISGTAISLNAVYTPTDASDVTLLWDNGATGTSASYTWPGGIHTAVVTATAACGDPVSAIHTVTVAAAVIDPDYSVYLPLLTRNASARQSFWINSQERQRGVSDGDRRRHATRAHMPWRQSFALPNRRPRDVATDGAMLY